MLLLLRVVRFVRRGMSTGWVSFLVAAESLKHNEHTRSTDVHTVHNGNNTDSSEKGTVARDGRSQMSAG